jgi:hypothetical protein
MQFEEFSAYFNSGSDVRNFILKYDFEKLAHTWEDIPPTLSEKFILEQLGKLRSPLDNEAVLRAAEELKSNRYLLSCYNFLCYYWWEHPDCQTYGHFLPEYGMNPAGRENEGIFYNFVRSIMEGTEGIVSSEETFELTRACLGARDDADMNLQEDDLKEE